MTTPEDMRTYVARFSTFSDAHPPAKRRASSQNNGTRRKPAHAEEWPHERPTAESLARAGFYFHPSQDNPDNVRCFFCDVKLDGWEPTDDALSEHVAHSKGCSWAQTLHAASRAKLDDTHDPLSEEHVQFRLNTFTKTNDWPHENKRGWKCKVKKMVEAGWVFDPSPEYEDGVTCFYCELSLDGWEPKDDPADEHRKRAPECAFFRLVDAQMAGGKVRARKTKAKSKSRGRTSTASKASRMSAQSVASAVDDDVDDDLNVLEDVQDELDNSMTSTSTAVVEGTNKTKKEAKPKNTAKTTRGRKRTNTVDSTREDKVAVIVEAVSRMEDGPASETTRLVEDNGHASALKPATANTKKTVGRKPKSLETAEPDLAIHDLHEVLIDHEVSTQLQEELEQSIDQIVYEDASPAPAAAKLGSKRTSSGLVKQSDSRPPGKTSKKQASSGQAVSFQDVSAAEFPWISQELPAEKAESKTESQAKQTKPTATKKGRPKKASSVRSSAATVTAAPVVAMPDADDLAADEAEIEAELTRIAAEELSRRERPAADENVGSAAEYEGTPSKERRHSREIRQLEREMEAERQTTPTISRIHSTTSPSGSDKENVPSSVIQPASAKRLPIMSPTKTTRIPLAPGTPNRALSRSPTKFAAGRSKLASAVPWSNVDLDGIFLASPQPTPNTLRQRLADAAGILTSPEKQMSIEEWVRWRAQQGEEQLRRQCEEMVGSFEKEGLRALRSLEEIQLAQ